MVIPDLAEIMQREEPLNPVLEPWVVDSPLGPFLKHPLVYQVLSPHMNAMVNAQFEAKAKRMGEKIAEGDISSALVYYEKPYRIMMLSKLHHVMDDRDFWETFGDCWRNCENLWQQKRQIRYLFYKTKHDPALRIHMMQDEDQRAFQQLPDTTITVYRGYDRGNAYAWCWTFSPSKARWFANRYNRMEGSRPRIAVSEVQTKDVLAIHTYRGEREVTIDPRKLGLVRNYHPDRLPRQEF